MSPDTFYKFAMIGRNTKETIIRPCILIGRTIFLKKKMNIKMTSVSNNTEVATFSYCSANPYKFRETLTYGRKHVKGILNYR